MPKNGIVQVTKTSNKGNKCVECKEVHLRKTKDGEVPADRFEACLVFKSKPVDQRHALIVSHNGCLNCTAWIHPTDSCPNSKTKCNVKISGSPCNADHNSFLHGLVAVDSGNVLLDKPQHVPLSTSSSNTLLPYQDIYIENSIVKASTL